MNVDTEKLIEVFTQISSEKDLKVSISKSLKGGFVTGASACIGGILLGPIGLALGGAVAGAASAICAKNTFKPVSKILMDMNQNEKIKLWQKTVQAFKDVGIEDILIICNLILSTASFKELALKIISDFFLKEMNLKIY